MSRRSVFTARVRALFQWKRLDRELDDEIRFHLEMQADDNIRAGMDPRQANHAAVRNFGGVTRIKEAHRERRAFHPIDTVAQDVRYALRMMRKSPGFTTVAVLSLAIGIGANTAGFSLADAILLRPLPVPRPGEVLTVGSTSSLEFSRLAASYRDYVDIRDRSTSFKGLVAFTNSVVGFAPDADTSPRLRIGMLVSANFFEVMGVEPELGRAFRPDELQVPGRDAVVILGHELWAQQFGADRAILGRIIRLNGIQFTVIGVAPDGFTGLSREVRFDFYAPLMMWPRLTPESNARVLEARDARTLTIKGRLKPGVTMSRAQEELSVIARDLERAYPDTNRNRTVVVRTELQARIASDRGAPFLAMLTALAGAVLFVACANVAGLLTSRAPVRAREMGLRLAIGASRLRVIRQLMTESVLIAMLGGILGLAVGYAGVTLFRGVPVTTDLPMGNRFELDRRALAFSFVMALMSAVLFGLVPAIRATRADLTAVMKATDAAGFGRRRQWGRAFLVGGQVAVSVVLIVVALSIYRGFQRLLDSGPGYRTDHVLLMSFDPGLVRYTAPQAQRFFEQVAERARLVAGVKSATLASPMPMDGLSPVSIVPEGFQFPAGKESATPLSSVVDESYFDTLGVSILKGRGFRRADAADAPHVAVVNELLAQHYWPGQDPVGKRFRLNDSRGASVEIVGLAKTSRYIWIMEPPTEFVYFPYKQRPQQAMVLLTESLGDPSNLVTPLREVVRSLDASQPVFNVRTMEEFYRMKVVSLLNVIVGIVAAIGMMGMALSIVGLHGLVAYAASRRTKEIGIRMAIGADRSNVLRMVLRQGLVLAITGLGVGLLVSTGVPSALSAVLPGGPGGDGRTDLVAFPLVAAAVLAVTLLAAYIPARRAARVNPTEALRCE